MTNDNDTYRRPKPRPKKLVIIFDGDNICFAGYADAAQEKKIMELLKDRFRIAH